MSELREDERVAAEDFASLVLGASVDAVEGLCPPSPDARVPTSDGFVGIEVTSYFDRDERSASAQEVDFLKALETEVRRNDPPPRTRFRLVMQDDGSDVVHQPAPGMEGYPAMAQWLNGVFFERSPSEVDRVVGLNQRSGSRPAQGLFPKGRSISALAHDLTKYARGLTDADFRMVPPGSQGNWPPTHHVAPARFKEWRQEGSGNGWEHRKLNAKLLNSEKYEMSGLSRAFLVIHNFVPLGEPAIRLWHPFWHGREGLLGGLALRSASRTVKHFEDVFFLDYSEILGGVVVYRLGDGQVVRQAEAGSRPSARRPETEVM